MISKKTFVNAVNEVQRFRYLEDGINEALKPYPDCSFWFPELEFLVFNLIAEAMEDYDGVISEWVYETDFGRSECYHGRYEEIKNSEDLYEFLVQKNKWEDSPDVQM